MIPNQPGLLAHSLLAAVAICAFLAPSAGAHAEEPAAGGARDGDRRDAEPTTAAAAVRPTTRITFGGWIGSGQDSARINIRFNQPVFGFGVGAVTVTCAPLHPACAEVASPSGNDGTRQYSVLLRMPQEYDGVVIVGIPENVVQNGSNEGNLAGPPITMSVDTKGPGYIDAQVFNGVEVVIVFDEDLDERYVPSPGDFQVSFRRGANVNVKTVSQVGVDGREVFLVLASPVDRADAVTVYYDDRGANAIRDRAGNRAFGFETGARHVTRETPTSLPGAPRSLTASADGPSAIDLDWDEPATDGGREITGYRIEVSENAGNTWSDLEQNTQSTNTQYRHEDLSPGDTRHYRVSAINSRGTGPSSNVAHATAEDIVPNAPRRVTARPRGRSAIELSWSAPTPNSPAPITGYRIDVSRSGTGGWITLVDDTESRGTTYTHDGLKPGETRYYRVRARNRAGWSEWSDIARATIEAVEPGAPTGLTVRPVGGPMGSSQLLVTWSPPSDDGGSAITEYRIWRSATRVGGWIPHASTGGACTTVCTYTDRDLTPATTWFYRVYAENAEGIGPASNVDDGTTNAAPPSGPQNVRARATGPSSILLAWDAPETDGGARVTGYGIQVQGPNDNSWIDLERNTGTTTRIFTHTGLEPVTRYSYRVRAINRVGEGAWSPMPPALPATALTHADKAGAPTGLTAQAVGTSRVDLSWNAPRYTGGVSIIGYRIEASDDGGGTWNIIRRNTNARTTTFSDVNLRPATTRHYRIAAVNLAGFGPYSNTARATTDATLPTVPRRLRAEAAGTSQITLSWQAPSDDGGARITGYRIEVSDDGARSWEDLVANTRTTATVHTHSGLEPASTRHYRVSAINRIGVGNASRVAGSTTDATVPDAPTGLVATAVTPTQIDLVWIAPAYNGGAPITGYRIEVSETGAAWVDLVPNTESRGSTFSHTGLLPGSVRHYRVSAINRAGTGAPSGSASAATDDPVQRAGRLNTRVLPHVAAAMTSSTVSAIARRVDVVASGMGMERRVETNGLSSMAASLSAPGTGSLGLAQGDGTGLAALFGGTSFQMPFGASDAPQELSTGTQLASWGGGEYHHLGEPGASALDWKGNMVSAHAGVDLRVGPDILAGVAGSYSSGGFDFTDKTGASPVRGTYGATMTGVHPYLAWFSGARGTSVWGSAGLGRGEIEVDDVREGLRTSPASMLTGAGGAGYQLLDSGARGIRIKAEGWYSRVKVDGGAQIEAVTLAMQRGKLALELTQGFRTDTGHELAVVLEGGMRYDNGDGVNGAGAEVGGGLRYTNSRLGVTAEGRGRFVLSSREGYEEWGFGGTLMLDPAARGEGLSIRVAPSYGDHRSGVDQLWERGVSDAMGGHGPGMGPSVDGEVAYGIAGFQGTPYGGFHLAGSEARAFSSGVRYDLGAGVGLRLEGTRRESGPAGAQHSVGVRGRIRLH